MGDRQARLSAIQQIIEENKIGGQEQLLDYLKQQGFSVTQATLSRDMKYLRIGKISDGLDGFYYALPNSEQEKRRDSNFIRDITRGFLSLDFSGNLCVLKTLPGHANSVAFALDNLEIDSVLGTMAGDDTIMIILKEDSHRSEFLEDLKSMIPELELET